MVNKNDMYSHLMNGGDPQVLLDAFINELNDAQKRVDTDKKAKEEAEKKAAAEKKEREEKMKNEKRYFNAAVSALGTYLTLVSKYEFKKEEVETALKAAIDGLVLSKKFLSALDEKGEVKDTNVNGIWDTIVDIFGLE